MIALDRKKAPEFHQVNNIKFLKPKSISLKNDIPLHTLSGGTQKIVKIDFIFNAGLWYQNQPLIAHATNALIKEGSKNYTAYEIADGIDQYGAFLQSDVSFDQASVTLYTLNKHLKKVLPFFKEVICSPLFSEKEFNIYKNNALEKFKVNLEKVSFVARSSFMNAIFGENNPYGRSPQISDYENLSLKEIQQFHANFYNLSNCEIVISGNVTPAIITTIDDFFGQENLGKNNTSNPNNISQSTNNNKIWIEKKGALQSAIRIGRQLPNKLHEDYFGLQIFNTILGGYFGSRLMKNIREDKGFTYGIGSGITSLQNGGYFFISTEVGSDVTNQALTEIYKEIELLQKEEVSLDELNLVKNYLLGQILKSCDGPFNMASLFEGVHFYGLNYDFYNNYIQAIKEITPKTLLALGVKYFNKSDLTEVVVGKV
ncbi:MAG: insulinase family protein [Vicingus serpentipes]|nr:insulinase family protein [Vicingus serpentipes]